MEYSKLVAVSGLPGLYELISSKSDGAVVRSLDDKSTRFISSRIHNFSSLESIEVFTVNDNVNLAEVFFAMEKSSDALPDTKDEPAVKKYFEKAFPDLDFERVYPSDLKKMLKWFDVLKKKEVEIKLPEIPEEPEVQEEPEEEPEKEERVEKKKTVSSPAKKAGPEKEKPKAQKEEKSEKKTAAAKTEKKPASKAKPDKKNSAAGSKKGNSKKGKK